MSCQQAAEAHLKSYVAVFDAAENPSTETLAKSMAGHYHYPFHSFVLGSTNTCASQQEMLASSTPYLEAWKTHGLGLGLKLKKSRVEVVSPMSAFCWTTWEFAEPKPGKEEWSWENVYCYRKMADGKEGFECVNCDNEILGLMQHAPEVLQAVQMAA